MDKAKFGLFRPLEEVLVLPFIEIRKYYANMTDHISHGAMFNLPSLRSTWRIRSCCRGLFKQAYKCVKLESDRNWRTCSLSLLMNTYVLFGRRKKYFKFTTVMV